MKKIITLVLFFIAVNANSQTTLFETIHSGTIVNGLNVVSSAKNILAGEKDSTFSFLSTYSDTVHNWIYVQVGRGTYWGSEFFLDSVTYTALATSTWRYFSISGDSLLNQAIPWNGSFTAAQRSALKNSGKFNYRLIARGHPQTWTSGSATAGNGEVLLDSTANRPTFLVERITNK